MIMPQAGRLIAALAAILILILPSAGRAGGFSGGIGDTFGPVLGPIRIKPLVFRLIRAVGYAL